MMRPQATPIRRSTAAALSIWVIAALLVALPLSAKAAPGATEIREALESTGPLESGGLKLDRGALAVAYRARDFEPVWAATPELTEAFETALSGAGREGLDPESFNFSALKAAVSGNALKPIDRELLLSDRFLAYAQVLAQGRVSPSAVAEDWLLARPEFDPAVVLGTLAQSGDAGATLASLLPSAPDYGRLRQGLERYRALAAAGGWQRIETDKKIEPGQKGDIVKALRARLVAEGDLAAVQGPGDTFDATLVAAMKRFQERHGLGPDGRVGAGTLAALNASVSDRIEQIKVTLERWREMPRAFPRARLIVNVAAATLTLYREGEAELTSRVIVGDVDHPTPVLAARIVATLFNPPWNVPTSITRKEIEPKVKRDPGYLTRNHYVVLGGRLQQQPGPWNALGGVKFELPNPLDVYLHDTPTRPLFAKAMRAASHGCVRVEAARPLASTLLGENWPAEAVNQAIASGETKRVYLKAVMPVYLLYLTAFVNEDGTVEFRDDIYGRDTALAAALADREIRRRLANGPGAG